MENKTINQNDTEILESTPIVTEHSQTYEIHRHVEDLNADIALKLTREEVVGIHTAYSNFLHESKAREILNDVIDEVKYTPMITEELHNNIDLFSGVLGELSQVISTHKFIDEDVILENIDRLVHIISKDGVLNQYAIEELYDIMNNSYEANDTYFYIMDNSSDYHVVEVDTEDDLVQGIKSINSNLVKIAQKLEIEL